MKKLLVSFCLAFTLITTPIAFNSCKTFVSTTANENVVVDAEKTLRISKDTFDIFLKLEKQNQVFVKAHLPQVHQFAEYIRTNAPTWLITANDLKNQYKHGTGNLNLLMAALNVLKQNSSQAQTYTSQLQQP
jgi:hypothetical protein